MINRLTILQHKFYIRSNPFLSRNPTYFPGIIIRHTIPHPILEMLRSKTLLLAITSSSKLLHPNRTISSSNKLILLVLLTFGLLTPCLADHSTTKTTNTTVIYDWETPDQNLTVIWDQDNAETASVYGNDGVIVKGRMMIPGSMVAAAYLLL